MSTPPESAAGDWAERGPAHRESSVCLEDRLWIKETLEGNPVSFEKLVKKYQDRIFQLCLRLLNCREDATEACQDVFVRAFQALPKFRPEAKFPTWLYQIALNRCRDGWKKKSARLAARSDSLQSHLSDLTCPSDDPGRRAQWRDDLLRLNLGLRAIARRHREILLLSCVENLPHRDCASILKCSERAIEGRIYRARRALNQWWEKE